MADGDPIIIGQANTASSPGNETRLSRNERTNQNVFVARNLNVGGGIRSEANIGNAVRASSASGTGVWATSASGYGALGISTSGHGVRGDSTSGIGLIGHSTEALPAILGDNYGGTVGAGGAGVSGTSTNGFGVSGSSDTTFGVYGYSPSLSGVAGTSTNGFGVRGSSDTAPGVDGNSTSGFGVSGQSDTDDGVRGTSTSRPGVRGISTNSAGVVGQSTSGHGVFGFTNNPAGSEGGFFVGGITVTTGSKNFKIDHPLDPQNRYLLHTCVESSEMKNVHDGVARLDEDGSAWVALPEWFEALNGDFRYQLTAVGGSAPNLHVAEEVSENRFKIAGGEEGLKVCWQVTGSRKDPWAAANPFEVEQAKPEEERGRYLDPRLYGAPEEQRVMIGPLAEAVEEEQRPAEPSGIDFARLEEENRRQIDEWKRKEEEHRREIEELRRRMDEEQEEAPPEST